MRLYEDERGWRNTHHCANLSHVKSMTTDVERAPHRIFQSHFPSYLTLPFPGVLFHKFSFLYTYNPSPFSSCSDNLASLVIRRQTVVNFCVLKILTPPQHQQLLHLHPQAPFPLLVAGDLSAILVDANLHL